MFQGFYLFSIGTVQKSLIFLLIILKHSMKRKTSKIDDYDILYEYLLLNCLYFHKSWPGCAIPAQERQKRSINSSEYLRKLSKSGDNSDLLTKPIIYIREANSTFLTVFKWDFFGFEFWDKIFNFLATTFLLWYENMKFVIWE